MLRALGLSFNCDCCLTCDGCCLEKDVIDDSFDTGWWDAERSVVLLLLPLEEVLDTEVRDLAGENGSLLGCVPLLWELIVGVLAAVAASGS